MNRVEGVPRRQGLEGRGKRLKILSRLIGVVCPAEDGIKLVEQDLVGKRLRVSRGNTRNQASLMTLVIQEHHFFTRFASKLTTFVAIRHGNLKRHLGRVRGGTVERDTSLNERAEHGEKAPARTRNGRRVRAVFSNIAVTIEQIRSGHAHVVEVEAPVVNTVQSALEPIIFAAHAGKEGAQLVTNGNE